MSATPLRVSFQGEKGAFSEEVAAQALGTMIETVPCTTFGELFRTVGDGITDAAIVPVENTLAGSVLPSIDLLNAHTNLCIVDEVVIRIVHNLIVPPGTPFEAIRRVRSHPVALAQCETFLRAHPQFEVVSTYDTAGAVKEIMGLRPREFGATRYTSDVAEAAIASARAAALYGAEILRSGIESDPQNFTRFFVVCRSEIAAVIGARRSTTDATGHPRETAEYKTSLVFRLAHKPGALHRALGTLASVGLDLTKIESRPIPGRPFEYSFHLDFIGDAKTPTVAAALGELAKQCESLRVLGSYPRAVSSWHDRGSAE